MVAYYMQVPISIFFLGSVFLKYVFTYFMKQNSKVDKLIYGIFIYHRQVLNREPGNKKETNDGNKEGIKNIRAQERKEGPDKIRREGYKKVSKKRVRRQMDVMEGRTRTKKDRIERKETKKNQYQGINM